MLFQVQVLQRQILVVFSGDTIVDREKWGSMTLGLAAMKLAFSLIDENPGRELYWFLISKGYKTYRFLPVYFHEFFPRYDQPTPEWAAEILHACGRLKFPKAYDATTGLVRGLPDACRLRQGIAGITDERMNDPHVKYFVERNPGHAAGDELCCIAALQRDNFAQTARRWIESMDKSRATIK
jgi:hypothetical protein